MTEYVWYSPQANELIVTFYDNTDVNFLGRLSILYSLFKDKIYLGEL